MEHFEPEQQRYIVQRLACYASYSKVAKEVQALYDIEASIPRLMYYNPLTPQGKALSAELVALFEETRAEYKARADGIPLGTQIGRLTLMQEIFDSNERNPVIQANMIKQAALETGVGTRAVVTDDGLEIDDNYSRLTDDELKQRIADAERRERERGA